MSVTLVVGSVVITGMLCSVIRYRRWLETCLAIVSAMESGKIEFSTESPTAAEQAEISENWTSMLAERGITEGEAEESRIPIKVLCVRNATIQTGARENWLRRPFLLVSAEHVGAFTVGD